VVRAWDPGSGPVVMWVKFLNILSTCRVWTGKPSTLMRRRGILPLLLLGFALTARHRWCMVTLGALGGTCQIAWTKDCKIRSRADDFWEQLGTAVPLWATYRVFWSTLHGLNQSIVGLSPLSETTYSTSHEIPNDGSWWILCLINCFVQLCLY
jgi:hypothetical protein